MGINEKQKEDRISSEQNIENSFSDEDAGVS